MKQTKKTIFWGLMGISIFGLIVLAYAIINTIVSLKYETTNPKDCISVVSGQDLCSTLWILKGLLMGCIAIILLLILSKKRFLKMHSNGKQQTQ